MNLLFLLVLMFSGCASDRSEKSLFVTCPLGGELPVYNASLNGHDISQDISREPSVPSGVMDIRQALVLALSHNPELAAFSWDIRAAEAREVQASVLPNPELGVDVENLEGDMEGFRETETTVSLAQNLLFGPKRSRAIRLAAADTKSTAWQYESKRLDVLTSTVHAFVDVLGAQEKVKFARETAKIAKDVLNVTKRRTDFGDASPVERTQADVVDAQVGLELDRAEQELHVARVNLAAQWGGRNPCFSEARGTLQCEVILPSLRDMEARLAQHPELMGAMSEVAKKQAALSLELVNRIPDVTAMAGYRQISALEDKDLHTFVLGLAVPLPLFDRNQGVITEARAELAKVEWLRKSAEVTLFSVLAEAHSDITATLKEREVYDKKILSGTEDVFRKIKEGYAQGMFNYLELLTAQESLTRTRSDYVDVLVRLNKGIATVERLMGEKIVTAAKEQQN
ncbi:MAG: hypothetical protein A2283_19340 [Lentisphaerae bacterium RIFOXYA12_FULL_48_11]|nr:MAG: hypothetical protein A2283_19340 [Lentisphaerae bacterium RIFOXYA12_FULL_48_11]